MALPQIKTLPVATLPDDVIDRVAKEIAAEVCEHIEAMYPDAAKAVAWNSCKRSIQGTIRNSMAWAGREAENGRIERWFKTSRKNRLKIRRLRRQVSP